MKKYLFPALALGLVMTSCQSDEPFAPGEGGEKQVTFTLNVPGELGTRADENYNSGVGGASNVGAANIKYTLVLDANGDTRVFKDATVSNDGRTATFTPTVVLGRNYTITAYASFDDNSSIDEINDIRTISVSKKFNDESKDAYFQTITHNFAEGDLQPLTLRRPFGKLRLVATDYKADGNGNTAIKSVKVKYNNKVFTTFDAVSGEFSNPQSYEHTLDGTNYSTSYYAPEKDENGNVIGQTIFADYIPVNSTGVAPFEITIVYVDGDEEYTRKFNQDIPIRRNALTTLKGNFFTAGAKITVTVDDAFDSENSKEYNVWNGQSDTSWYNDTDTEFTLTNPQQLAGLAELVDGGNTFEGKTIKLDVDVDLSEENWNPIGDNSTDKAFTGVFDGQNHTIKGAHITGDHCFNGAVYGSKEGWGLFSVVDDGASIKNLKVDGATFGSYTVISGTIAGYAKDTTFENIEITNTKIAGYNWYTGGVVGWAEGECTFKDVNLDKTVAVGTLWDSHGQNAGGIAGGVSASAKITIEDCNIACVMDVINDVTSNYKWYIYRVAGMIIGNTNTTEEKYNEVVTATATNVTCKNVTVTYGDWMNYHYCEGFWNRGWGRYESSDYVGGVDQNEPHNHPDGEAHLVTMTFDQLFGGGSNGSGHYPVRGLAEFPGVTVNYPASYRRGVSTTAALNDALGKGLSVVLENDIDFGSTQLAIAGENQVVDLGGHELTTANNWGGISLKNGACIKNGTITHTGNTAAIKAFNGTSVENVTINATCSTADKTVTAIAVQEGANVEYIKNVTINGVSQGIEVGYKATVGLIENAVVNESNNGTAKGIGLVINGGMVGKAKNCTFKGETYGITLHLKGVFAAGLELENCTVEGTTASIYAWDEKGISNTSGSLILTYDAATTLNGPFVWDFEDECQSVVTLNRPQ